MRRAVVLLGLVACGAPRPASPGAGAVLQVIVMDADGPVAGADLRLVTLAPAPCPCAAAATEDHGDPLEACGCPAALARWQDRLARCEWPARAATIVRTDAAGRASVRRTAGVTGLEVARDGGVRWLPWPDTRDPIALELAPSIAPRVTIEGADGANHASIRGAFLFDDGHCVPLVRDGDGWTPGAPLPRSEEAEGTLVVEATGYPVLAYDLADEESIELELVHADDLADLAPEDRELDEGAGDGRGCTDVLVVDDHGRPITDAWVGLFRGHHGGRSVATDARGLACVEDLGHGGELVIHAPLDAGGACAGSTSRTIERGLAVRPPLQVRLDVEPLARVPLRGRVVTGDGTPVTGADVSVRDVQPAGIPGCNASSQATTRTGPDGSFALPALPRGTVTLAVLHDWYAEQKLELANDGTVRTVVLDRGGRWTGRVLDPDGAVIDRCTLFVTLANDRLLTTTCSAAGFAVGTLTVGEAKVQVRLDHHALGTFRTLHRTVMIATNGLLIHDLAFPRGEDLGGRVVDGRGNPVPGARLTALPEGVDELADRFHPDEVMLEADADGRFLFRHLTPGRWRLRGDRRSGAQATLTFATGALNVQFVVPPGGEHVR